MKRHLFRLTLILSILYNTSCEKVKDLSDDATIKAFKVTHLSEPEMILSTPLVRNDSIIIPVEYGKYLFPLTMLGTPMLEGDRARILNIDFSQEQTYESVESTKEFYVSSASGVTKKWVLCFDIQPSSEDTDITSFEIERLSPANFVLSTPVFRRTQSEIYMIALAGSLPVGIVPQMGVAPGAKILDYQPGDAIEFTEYNKPHTYTVQSASGKEQQWVVNLYKGVTAAPGITSPEIMARLNIPQETFLPSIDPTTSEYEIKTTYFDAHDIRMIVQKRATRVGITRTTSEELIFPISVKVPFSMNANSQCIGFTPGDVLTFTGVDDVQKFFMLDNISSTYVQWTIHVAPVPTNEANLEKFTITSYSSAGNLMKLNENVIIDLASRTVTVPIIEAAEAMPLTLSASTEISLDATFATGFPPSMVFNSLTDVHTFEIVSSLGDVRNTWRVVLRNDANRSDQAEVESFSINSEFPRDVVYLEPSKAQITIITPQNAIKRFIPTVTISEKATLSGLTSGAELSEDLSFTSDKTFEVRAENGTVKQWRIKMIHAPQVEGTALTALATPWSSANNSVVEGTTVEKRGSTDIIRMTTKEQNAVIYGKLIAAGSLFIGSFAFDLSTTGIDYPRTMTKFGLPFAEKPIGFSLDMRYIPGAQLKQAKKKNPGSATGLMNQWSISNITGTDEGQIWVDVINYEGDISKIPNSYSGEGLNGKGQPIAGLTVLGRGEIVTSGTSGEWVDGSKMAITYSNPTLPVTHIAIVMSSSMQGDKYIGAPGSILDVSNFRLIYYKADVNAIPQ